MYIRSTAAVVGLLTLAATAYADSPGDARLRGEVIHSDVCGCSVSAYHGLRPHSVFEEYFNDPAISLGNNGREAYLVVESFNQAAYTSGSLTSALVGYFDDNSVSPRAPLTYFEINGRPAASVSFKRKFDSKGGSRNRVVAVDAGDRLIVITAISTTSTWWDNKDRFDDIIMSLQVDDSTHSDALHTWPDELNPEPLLQAREGYVSETLAPRRQHKLDRPPDDVPLTRIQYPSPVGDLYMYSSTVVEAESRRPAIIWVPAATTFDPGESIWEDPSESTASVQPFLDNGFRVFVPSFRGMSENPGEHEFFLGEVDDLLAAIEFVKSSDGVDSSRVYLAGIGNGSTLVMLAAVAGADVRASFTYDGSASLREIMAAGGFAQQPFAVFDKQASALRSPIHWADRLQAPLFYVADDSRKHNAEEHMARLSRDGHAQMTVIPAPYSSRANTVQSVIDVWIAQIHQDEGPYTTVEFNERTLYDAAIDRYGRRTLEGR